MTCLSKTDVYLANSATNSCLVGQRYMIHLADQIDDYGVRGSRNLILHLYNSDKEIFQDAVDFAESQMIERLQNLSGQVGTKIVEFCSSYLHKKYDTRRPDYVIDPFIDKVKVWGSWNDSSVKFCNKHLPRQRIYLQCLTNYMEMLAGIVCFNSHLIDDEDYPNFTVERQSLDVTSPLFKPTRNVVISAYVIRHLLTLKNLQADFVDAMNADNVIPGEDDEAFSL